MWRFKSCARCNGDSYIEKDHYGWYERCLQCGNGRDIKITVGDTEEHRARWKELMPVGGTKTRTFTFSQLAETPFWATPKIAIETNRCSRLEYYMASKNGASGRIRTDDLRFTKHRFEVSSYFEAKVP